MQELDNCQKHIHNEFDNPEGNEADHQKSLLTESAEVEMDEDNTSEIRKIGNKLTSEVVETYNKYKTLGCLEKTICAMKEVETV